VTVVTVALAVAVAVVVAMVVVVVAEVVAVVVAMVGVWEVGRAGEVDGRQFEAGGLGGGGTYRL